MKEIIKLFIYIMYFLLWDGVLE